MSRPALGRIVATATLMTIAVGASAGTAVAATPAHTSLSIRSVSSVIRAGGHDVISGVLLSNGQAVQGADVTLDAKPAGASSFTPRQHAATGPKGRVAFTVTPEMRTAYKLVFAGTSAYAPSRSGIVTVDVRRDLRLPTSLSIRAAKSAINPGGKDVISGVLLTRRQPLADRLVVLKSKAVDSTTWRELAAKRTGRHGFVAFTVAPSTRTHYQLVFRGNRSLQPSRSGVVTVNVRTPATLSSAVAATSINPGASDTVSGVLSSANGPAVGRPVVLLAKPSGVTTWQKVATATTASDGSVAFIVTPATTTRYVLVHYAGWLYTFARSPVVTVTVLKPSSLSVRLTGNTVSGTLLGPNGGELAGRTVTLLSRAAGSSDAFTAVTTAATNDHGFVAFDVNPSSSTDYALAFAGDDTYQGCQSGVVTVTVS